MNYRISYVCESNVGKCRVMNQDNFLCNGEYMKHYESTVSYKVSGSFSNLEPAILGVFDGVGGESCGEVASLIAAAAASETDLSQNPVEQVRQFCYTANNRICDYAAQNRTGSMGTTAALLAFSEKEITLCNIGDSKVFRLAKRKMKQISLDHYAYVAANRKAPLSQYLGIPGSDMLIEPYLARGRYEVGDLFLICSDGLTDMVPVKEIEEILLQMDLEDALNELMLTALENGGRDNITVILCSIEKDKNSLIGRLFGKKR